MVEELKNEKNQSLREAAKIELGLRKFLEKGNYKGFTDTFEVRYFLLNSLYIRNYFFS